MNLEFLPIFLSRGCGHNAQHLNSIIRFVLKIKYCDKCYPRNLFARDESGVCNLEKDFPMTTCQRSELKLPLFDMETEKVQLKAKDEKIGQNKIWRIKTLTSRVLDFDTWLMSFQEQFEQAWIYYQRVY